MQVGRQVGWMVHKQAGKKIGMQGSGWQAGTASGRQADWLADRQAGSQSGKQALSLADRQEGGRATS